MKALLSFMIVIAAPLMRDAAMAAEPHHTIKIENMQFAPAKITVKAGETILWTNGDLVPHTVTALNGSFDSKSIEPGKSWSHKIKKVGVLEYKCSFHPTMKAQLTVKK